MVFHEWLKQFVLFLKVRGKEKFKPFVVVCKFKKIKVFALLSDGNMYE